MIKKFSPLALLMLSANLHAMDLSESYTAALSQDPVFTEARAKLEAYQERLPQGRAGIMPNLSFSANAMLVDENVHRPSNNTNNQFDSNGMTLSLTQPLFRRQNWVAYDQAKLIVAQAEVSFANAKQDLILRVSQAYFDVLYAEENLRATQALKTAVASQLDIAQKAFEIGTGVKTDIYDALSRFDLASSQVISAETDVEMRQQVLENIVGKSSKNLARKRQAASLNTPEPADMSKWMEMAEQANLAVLQQQFSVDIAGQEMERQRAGHFPTLDLVASTGRASTENSGVREITEANKIGVQLSLPIYQGGEINSKQAEAAANQRASMSALETSRRGAKISAKQAYLGVVNGLAQIKALEAALVASQDALESNKAGLEVGIRLGIDVLNAQNQVYTARRDLTRVTVDTMLSQLKLKAAVGNLTESDVQTLNSMLGYDAR